MCPIWKDRIAVGEAMAESTGKMPDLKPMATIRSVPSNQIQRSWGSVSDQALRDPIVITAKGRPRHVLMAFDEYERLKARDRRAYRVDDLPDDLAGLLEQGLDALRAPEVTADDGDIIIR